MDFSSWGLYGLSSSEMLAIINQYKYYNAIILKLWRQSLIVF